MDLSAVPASVVEGGPVTAAPPPVVCFRVQHRTQYTYPALVHGSLNEARLKPRRTASQDLEHFQMQIQPPAAYLAEHVDTFGNPTAVIGVEHAHLEWSVTANSIIRRYASDQSERAADALRIEQVRQQLRQQLTAEGLVARYHSDASPLLPFIPNLANQLAWTVAPSWTVAELGQWLMEQIHTQFRYQPGYTEVSTPLSKVIAEQVGVCQDFAHVAIALARSLGIPARYVSGYLETQPPPGQARLVGADATHAWFALYDPVAGWLEYDPTNNAIPDQRYITLAWGRDYSDVAPISGVVRGGGASHSLAVSVDVLRLDNEDVPA